MIEYEKGCCIKVAKSKNKNVVIPHIVNDAGFWGSGVVMAISKEWPISLEDRSPEYIYRNYLTMLGQVEVIRTNLDKPVIYVANMCAQKGIDSLKSTGNKKYHNSKPIRYSSLVKCMEQVKATFNPNHVEIVAPKFGSLRSGGNWDFIEELIDEIWKDFKVTVCEYE